MQPHLKDDKDNQLEVKFKSSPTEMDIGLKFASPRYLILDPKF